LPVTGNDFATVAYAVGDATTRNVGRGGSIMMRRASSRDRTGIVETISPSLIVTRR
jgi:hypothetical protein